MIHYMESISQCIRAASPARSVWMSFWGMICLTQSAQASRILYLHSSVYRICPGKKKKKKIFNSVKGMHWVSWESRLALMHMTAAVSFTLCSVDRCGNSEDLSWSTAALTARAAPAINNSRNNNQRCLFFPELSISMTDLFWRWWLFWQISGADIDCSLSVCCVHADGVSAACAEMTPSGHGGTRCTAEAIVTFHLHIIARLSLNCLVFHTSECGLCLRRLSSYDPDSNKGWDTALNIRI